jgi:acylphosphatase
MGKITRYIHVYGRVQGVFFRESMRQKALELGITGWVRNRADGRVEAVVQGAPDSVERIIAWARRGPEHARVDRVETGPADGEFDSFERLASL